MSKNDLIGNYLNVSISLVSSVKERRHKQEVAGDDIM